MTEEIWKDIEGFENYYQVSNIGRVRSLDRSVVYSKTGYNGALGAVFKGKILHIQTDKRGYVGLNFSKNRNITLHRIHRLVAIAFIKRVEGKAEVNHIDGNKGNNCVENLEWCNRSENNKHAFSAGLNYQHKGKFNKQSIAVDQYDLNGNFIRHFACQSDAEQYGFNTSNISRCCRGLAQSHGGYKWKIAL
jgi:hypothetical protein